MIDIEKYLPLNSEEKIMNLLMDVKNSGEINMTFKAFVNEVVYHIRKAKLQVLFREEIQKTVHLFKPKELNQNKIKTAIQKPSKPNKKALAAKENKGVNLRDRKKSPKNNKQENQQIGSPVLLISPKNIIGKDFIHLTHILGIDPYKLVAILTQHKIDLYKILSMRDYHLIKYDLSRLVTKNFDNEIEKHRSETTSIDRLFLKQKPSLGIEGNYFKLIFNHPKS